MSEILYLNPSKVKGDNHYNTQIDIFEFYQRGKYFGEVVISRIEVSREFLDVLEQAASKPISKLSIAGLSFRNNSPVLVDHFIKIIRNWLFEEIWIYASPTNDSWHQVVARGLVNKPIRRMQFNFIPEAPEVNLCNFDLPRVYIPTIEFYGCGVIVPQPIQHMQCRRLMLNRVDDSSLVNLRELIERADPNFELGLETEGVSDALNELLALNKISELRLKNFHLTEDLLNKLAEGIKSCQSLTTLSFTGIRTRLLCDVLWEFFEKIKSHEKLQEIKFPCDHGGMCYNIMNETLRDVKQGIIPLFEFTKINHYSQSTGQLPQLPVDILKNVKSFLVPPKRPRPDLPDQDTLTQ